MKIISQDYIQRKNHEIDINAEHIEYTYIPSAKMIFKAFKTVILQIKNTNKSKLNMNIDEIFAMTCHIMFLFKSLLHFFYILLENNQTNQAQYNLNIVYIYNYLDTTHNKLINKYNDFVSIKLSSSSISYSDLLLNASNAVQYISNNELPTHNQKSIITKTNLDIYELDELVNNTFTHTNVENISKPITLEIPYENVNIGFNNFYKLHIYKSLDSDIPLNMLVYVKDIDQVVIKVGNKNNYKFINSKLYRTYDIKNKITNTIYQRDANIKNEVRNNDRSILCNNNIKSQNKKCQNGVNCKYYHDIILGYEDNFHSTRQFSSNPIIYNCINFKDGYYVNENIKKIDWTDAINMYQSNLSCILIACMHSMN